MASPQTENGYTTIANELLEAIYRHQFSANGFRLVAWIIRQTYGWKKKAVNGFSYRRAATDMKMSVSSVHLALQVLIEHKVLVRDEHAKLKLNKDYEAWEAFSPLNTPVQPAEHPRSAHRTPPFSPLNAYKDKTIPAKTIPAKTILRTDPPVSKPVVKQEPTDIQRVVNAYKIVKGIAKDDKGWDKANYARYSKAAKTIIEATGNGKRGAAFVIVQGNHFISIGITWTLETIARHAWDKKGEINGIENDAGEPFAMGADKVPEQRQLGRDPHSGEGGGEILERGMVWPVSGEDNE